MLAFNNMSHVIKRDIHITLFMSCIWICGCQKDESTTSIKDYLSQQAINKAPHKNLITPTQNALHPFEYKKISQRDPFMPFIQNGAPEANQSQVINKIHAPNTHRNRELLEAYPLNTLTMQGHVEFNNEFWALVKSSDHIIHRVKTGNYLGINYGKISDISPNKISVIEVLQDQNGLWHEQTTFITLAQ